MAKKVVITKAQAAIVIAIVVVAGVAGVGYFILSQPPPAPRDSILVGWVHSLSGGLAGQTGTFDVYYKWIIEDYNAKGGLYVPEYGRNFTLKYIEYDDTSNLNTMLTLTERLITVDKVDLLFPPVSTAFNLAAFPTYQKYHMPVIALTFGSDIGAAEMRSGTFSYCFSVLGMPSETGDEVAACFKYINSTLDPNGLNSVGIIYHDDQHGLEYSAGIQDALSTNGFDIALYKKYEPGIPDFTPLINDLQAANPDVVILCGYEGVAFIQKCKTLAYNPKLLVCGPSAETPFLVYPPIGPLTPADINGTMLYDGWPATAYNTPELAAWAQMHYDRTLASSGFHWWPFPASATFYAGLQCLFEAVNKVGLDHAKIRDALAYDNFTTILGNTHLNQGYSMECELAGTLAQWQGGQMCEIVWPLSAASAPIIYPKPAFP